MEAGAINWGFAAASAIALITFGVHTFVGGVFVVRPLLAARNLTPASRWLNYYCWHLVTVVLLFMAAGFAWAAGQPTAADLATMLTAMSAVFSPLCAWVAMKGRIAPWRFPATTLFLLVAVAGLVGLFGPQGSLAVAYAPAG